MQFEDNSVISFNESNPINIDLKYTLGEYYYMLNPLYIDYYDMYFIPDDQCVLNQLGYENSTYVNYIINNTANYVIDEIEPINILEDVDGSSSSLGTDILHSSGTLDNFGRVDMFVITVDEHQNIYIKFITNN